MTEPADITAIFVTFNSSGVIEQALDGVPECMPVIIIDNASRDDTLDIVRRKRPQARIEANAENVGYGAALNKGLALADTSFVFMLNPDVIISLESVVALRNAATKFTNGVLFGPAMVDNDGKAVKPPRHQLFHPTHPLFKPLLRKDRGGMTLPQAASPVGWIVGAAMFARRHALLNLGGFDESIFLFFEETDLCYRAFKSGHPPVWVPEAVVVNFQGRSSGVATISSTYFREWHFSWSQYYLARKYGGAVKLWDAIVRPSVYWLKRLYYRTFGADWKAAYYAARFDGAIASLKGDYVTQPLSPWDAEAPGGQ